MILGVTESEFQRNVFINCPFDKDFSPILQAIIFCVMYLGFEPRLASEKSDSGEARLAKIAELISISRFSIHDLSRSEAAEAGDLARHNMPFELGLDYGCRKFASAPAQTKSFLILDTEQYRYQKTLSDLAGCDIEAHADDPEKALRKVRNWLGHYASSQSESASAIFAKYTTDFQEWHYVTQLALGFKDEDIQDYPTGEFMASMKQWFAKGQPPGRLV